MIVFYTEHINTNTWGCFVSFLCQRIVIHCTCTAWLNSELCPSFIPSTCAHDVCGSPSTLILSIFFTFYLTHLLSHSLHFFTPLEARRLELAAHSAQKEHGFHRRDLLPHRLWAQRLRLQGGLLSSPTQSSWTRRGSSPTKGFPLGRRLGWRCTRGYASWS